MSDDNQMRFKVIFVGDSAVGKTTFVSMLCQQETSDQHIPTIGAGFYNVLTDYNGKRIIFDVWDTAGQELYRSLIPQYARGAQAAVVMVDVTERRTFNSLDLWRRFIEENTPDITVLLFLNKTDLVENRVVTKEEGIEYAARNCWCCLEGSAINNEGIKESLNYLSETLYNEWINKGFANAAVPNTILPKETKQGCCF